jgi:hypothetical protein
MRFNFNRFIPTEHRKMSSVVAPVVVVDNSVELSLVERISQIEESLKDLKRAARNELKSRRRRRAKRNADGTAAPKGETPEQLKAWHEEVRKVWDEMRKADDKTPYKHAVAEASARRKNSSKVVSASSVPAVEVKKVKKVVSAPAPVPVEVEAPKKRVAKKTA